MKYQISYTLKNPEKPHMHREYFKSKKAANEFLKENADKLYWHQLVETSPKSKTAKYVATFEPGDEFILKVGTLQTHYETGMECLGLVFYEDGINGPPNPNFDPTKPETSMNFKNYASWDAMTFLESGQILQVGDGEKFVMVKDRDMSSRDGYRLSFYPRGFGRKELIDLFGPGTVKGKLWIKKEAK